MRVSKKLMRDSKRAMSQRIKELCKMNVSALCHEHERCFPDVKPHSVSSHGERLNGLLQDLLDRAFPDHWFDTSRR